MRTAVSTYQTFSTDEKPLSILDVRDAKNRRKLAMVTAYDTPSARIVDRAGVDMVLVGDSLGMVMLGLYSEFTPRFVKRYAELGTLMEQAVRDYAEEVRSGAFPTPAHSFSMDEEERARLEDRLRKTE